MSKCGQSHLSQKSAVNMAETDASWWTVNSENAGVAGHYAGSEIAAMAKTRRGEQGNFDDRAYSLTHKTKVLLNQHNGSLAWWHVLRKRGMRLIDRTLHSEHIRGTHPRIGDVLNITHGSIVMQSELQRFQLK